MSRFFSEKLAALEPYVPGEQPQDQKYVKLNTNESPYPPSQKARAAAAAAAERMHLYPDPDCAALKKKLCEVYGLSEENVLFGNGSDEILNFAFLAFCDETHGAAFPNVTYGFYPVFAAVNRVPYTEFPLREDFTVNVEDYIGVAKTVFLANPNAPTGIALPPAEIARIARSNPDSVVVVDEAYVDFGAESCLPLIGELDNLLVVQTFSKSRSMAGARLGFCAGNAALIADLNTVRCSTNPYNVNALTMAAGIGVLEDEAYTRENCRAICRTRSDTAEALRALGFTVTPSQTNFLFARHERIGGETLYRKLKARGVLVRHFNKPEISRYNRITIGTREQMEILLAAIRTIMEEEK
ncbi:MAG: histidinol-phosphate transaminase [Oscillibacter sp.]|nr:histidinol-phosphate transaminase [Oscillibacter sp.]